MMTAIHIALKMLNFVEAKMRGGVNSWRLENSVIANTDQINSPNAQYIKLRLPPTEKRDANDGYLVLIERFSYLNDVFQHHSSTEQILVKVIYSLAAAI